MKRPLTVCLALLVTLLGMTGNLRAEEKLIDEVACSVNGAAITRTQVEQEARIRLAEQQAYWAGRLPADFLSKVLDDMVAHELLRQEMERVRPPETVEIMDADQRAKILFDFRRKFLDDEGYQRFLSRMRLSEAGLLSRLIVNHRIEDFVNERLSLIARVDERELEEHVKLIAAREFVSPDERKTLRKKVRRDLEEAKRKQALVQWIAELSDRGRIYQLVTFEKETPPLPINRNGKAF